MSSIIVIYRDLKKDGYNNRYEILDLEIERRIKIVKEQIMPGKFGFPDTYIRHLSITLVKGGTVPIISYTDYELTPVKRSEILNGSFQLLTSNE